MTTDTNLGNYIPKRKDKEKFSTIRVDMDTYSRVVDLANEYGSTNGKVITGLLNAIETKQTN